MASWFFLLLTRLYGDANLGHFHFFSLGLIVTMPIEELNPMFAGFMKNRKHLLPPLRCILHSLFN